MHVFTVAASAVDQDTMPVGTCQIQMVAGPSLTPVGPAVAADITAPAGSGSSTGAGN